MLVSFVSPWVNDKNELIDSDGAVWQTKKIEINSTVESGFSDNYDLFVKRTDCLFTIRSILSEIKSMIPHGMNVQILDNAHRLVRDAQMKNEFTCNLLAKFIKEYRNDLRLRLRVGGCARSIRKDKDFSTFEHGRYFVTINDGSRYRRKIKTYNVTIEDDRVIIQRIT